MCVVLLVPSALSSRYQVCIFGFALYALCNMSLCLRIKKYACSRLNIFLFIYDSHRMREREREAETQEEGEADSMHREPDVGFDPGSPGSCPGPKAGAKPLSHPGSPRFKYFKSYHREVQ